MKTHKWLRRVMGEAPSGTSDKFWRFMLDYGCYLEDVVSKKRRIPRSWYEMPHILCEYEKHRLVGGKWRRIKK